MYNKITAVDEGSPAAKAGIEVGERLVAINGQRISDVLDYRFYSGDARLYLETHTPTNAVKLRRVLNQEYVPLGLNFENYLIDRPRGCANRCVFCFIDQLPPGLRESLYFKDDDARLSFLQGNYITLTNLTEREIERVLALRISPVYVSVHATNPDVRARLMGNERAGDVLPLLRRLADGGIVLHCQIVVCPGWNNGAELERTLRELPDAVASVSVVPVGLTRYREGLTPLKPVDREGAGAIIDTVARVGRKRVYCADELYLKAERRLPRLRHYDDFPQFENGVGMLRLFEYEFRRAMGGRLRCYRTEAFSVATGTAAAPLFRRLLRRFDARIFAVRNDFFGESVDVAGLVTGGDLIAQLKGQFLGTRLYIPSVMLRDGGDVFLDNVTLADIERELSVPVMTVDNDGERFYETIAND